MSGHVGLEPVTLLWLAGWLVALIALAFTALRLPLQLRLSSRTASLYSTSVVALAAGVAVLAVVAVSLHDAHIDLTREKTYTPSMQAIEVVDRLDQPVRLVYFYRSQDPEGRRTRDILRVMGRRNVLLTVETVDPDREPTLAQAYGIRLYNAGLLEAGGRRVLVNTTDEAQIAIGIQRVLRQHVLTACFIEGHNELPMDNFEFHTHLEGVAGHSHGDAASKLVQTTGHGAGRLRRALEAQGYEARQIVLATMAGVPSSCTVIIAVSPRSTFLPEESKAIENYLAQGGALLLLLDLGFSLEPRLAALLHDLGVQPEQQAVVDPLSHYSTDPEMVAVTGYDSHPITRSVSMTFFPGARPLTPVQPAPGVRTAAIVSSSRDSYGRAVAPVAAHEVTERATDIAASAPSKPGPRMIAVAAEGTLPGAARPFRAIVTGDGDFASNSFFPYMANSDLALSMVRWLAREENSTTVATRMPVLPMILLTTAQMYTVFLFCVIALPLVLVAAGAAVWWGRR
ncbi:MAG: Gldg family protein [Burkholderiales bacterium]|nr:Gldg family protein [Burkholderiales bacterium]